MRENLERQVRAELQRTREQIDRLRDNAYLLKLELRDRKHAVAAALDAKWRELRCRWIELSSAGADDDEVATALEYARERLRDAIRDARWVGPGRHRFRDEQAPTSRITKYIA